MSCLSVLWNGITCHTRFHHENKSLLPSSMYGENQPLVTDEPLEFEEITSWRFKTAGKLPIVLEESVEYTSTFWRKTKRSQHVTGWTGKHLDLNQWHPKTSPNIVQVTNCWEGRVIPICAGKLWLSSSFPPNAIWFMIYYTSVYWCRTITIQLSYLLNPKKVLETSLSLSIMHTITGETALNKCGKSVAVQASCSQVFLRHKAILEDKNYRWGCQSSWVEKIC